VVGKTTVCRIFSYQRAGLAGFSRALKMSNVEKFQPEKNSGEYRARTGDLLVANQALSQLS
jgi:hypothetical protein